MLWIEEPSLKGTPGVPLDNSYEFVDRADYTSDEPIKRDTFVYFEGQGPLLEAVAACASEGWVDVVWYRGGSNFEPVRDAQGKPVSFRVHGRVEIAYVPPQTA